MPVFDLNFLLKLADLSIIKDALKEVTKGNIF